MLCALDRRGERTVGRLAQSGARENGLEGRGRIGKYDCSHHSLSSVKHWPDGASSSITCESKVTAAIPESASTIASGRGTWPDEAAATGATARQVLHPARAAPSGASSGRCEDVDLAAGEEHEASGNGGLRRFKGARKVVTGIDRNGDTQTGREGAADARARAQAQLGRADQAREGPARDARRASRPDRRRLRAGARGGPRPPEVVGALPRQAEDRDVHAPDQAARGPGDSRAAGGGRRALTAVREGVGRALDPADDPAPLPRARLAAGGLPPARRGGADDGRRVRRRRPERDRLPCRRPRTRRALRRDARRRRGDALLLRQPGLLRPAAQAQDHDLRVRTPLQRAGDQLHRARRRAPGRRAGLRRPRRRRPLVGAPARARPRGLRPGRRSGAGALRAARRVEGRPPLPRLAGQGPAQVHGRRHRARGHARRGGATARLRAAGLPARRGAAADRPHGRAAGEGGQPRLARRPGGGRAALRRADGRGRAARRRGRARRPRDAAAEPRPDLDSRRRASSASASGWRSSGSRSQATRSAPRRSHAPASRTATSPSRRRSRGSPPSSSTSRHASATRSRG